MNRIRQYWALGLLALMFATLYSGVLTNLVENWERDENYSHGFVVIPVVLYLIWDRRESLTRVPVHPSWSGAWIVAASLGVLLVGTAGIELFVTRISMIGVIAGAIVYLLGWQFLRALAFPVAFLLLMIPLPAIIFNQVAFPLQLVATEFGVSALQLANVPVLREGNVIVLATTTLEVAEACSGIRSLVSLLTVALLYGYLSERRLWMRTVIAMSSVPVAIVANGMRVAGTGYASHHFGAEAATGFLHEFSGWLVFVCSLAMIVALERVLRIVVPPGPAVVANLQRNSI